MLDRVVADVDGQAILASDVDDEMRFSALLPGTEPAADNTPQRALNRVIDRTLIDQQRALQPGVAVISKKMLNRRLKKCGSRFRLQQIRIARPKPVGRHIWRSMVFTPDEVQDRMRERLAILKFIDVRFGVVVQVSNADVRNYYDQVLTPELKQSKAALPDLRTVAPRIREILRQRQVSNLIDEWLKSLRTEGHVQILDSAYADDGKSGESLTLESDQ